MVFTMPDVANPGYQNVVIKLIMTAELLAHRPIWRWVWISTEPVSRPHCLRSKPNGELRESSKARRFTLAGLRAKPAKKRLIATVVPWMVLIPPPVSSVCSVSAVLSRGLILRRNHAVGIATSIDVDVIAVAAPSTTNLVHHTIGVARGSCGKVSSQCCSSNCDYHLEPPYPVGKERSSIVEVPEGRIIRTPVLRRLNGTFTHR